MSDSPQQPRQNEEGSAQAAAFGLCSDCCHAQRVASSKGSTFLLCGLSKVDPRFPKYPRLPVLSCSGHAANPAARP